MKKLFAIVAVMGVLTFGSTQLAQAQDAPAAEQTEQAVATDSAATQEVAAPADEAAAAPVSAEEGGIHKELKVKFIEGSAFFMSFVAIALVIGLAFCIERVIYLSLAEVNSKKLIAAVEAALEKGDVEAAKDVCRNTRGPIASIFYQGLMRVDQGIDVVEKVISLKEADQEFLTNKTILAYLGGVSKEFIKDLRETGVLPFYKVRNTIFYKVSDVKKMIERHRV